VLLGLQQQQVGHHQGMIHDGRLQDDQDIA
jgi:hypothetical protein